MKQTRKFVRMVLLVLILVLGMTLSGSVFAQPGGLTAGFVGLMTKPACSDGFGILQLTAVGVKVYMYRPGGPELISGVRYPLPQGTYTLINIAQPGYTYPQKYHIVTINQCR